MGENTLSKQMYVLIVSGHPRSSDLKRLADEWDGMVRALWNRDEDVSIVEIRQLFQAWSRANRIYHECIGEEV